MQLQSKTFWLALNSRSNNGVLDAFTNGNIVIPQANYVEFRCASFQGDPALAANLDTDLTNVVDATIILAQGSAGGTVLFQQTVPLANFHNSGCTFANWANQSDWQWSFILQATDTNWAAWSANTIWCAINIDIGNGPVTVATGVFSFLVTGLATVPQTVVSDPTYPTTAQMNAAYLQLAAQTLTTSQKLQVAQNLGIFPGVNFALFLGAGNLLTGSAVIQETGSGTSLDKIDLTAAFGPLASLPVGFLLTFVSAAGEQTYVVQSGNVSPGPGIVCNANYNSGTQPKYLKQV